MTTLPKLTQRQRDVLSALSERSEYQFDDTADFLEELQQLKREGCIKERLGSQITTLSKRANLELHLSITSKGQAYLSTEDMAPPISIRRQRRRAQCFTEPAIALDLVLVPGGTFTMGSPPEELDRRENESPQHEVTLSPFLMGRYPITQAQWRAIATREDLQDKRSLKPDPAKFKGDDHPVEQVSWDEAVEFCKRLSQLTGHTYRLPSEAEWEYACRAGTTTPFYFGETITTDLANYRGASSYGDGPEGVYRGRSTPVNHFHPLANAFGLCDMHGNVFEWCQDSWHGSYENAPVDGSAWSAGAESSLRVRRGGSWYFIPRYCRSAFRYDTFPGDLSFNIGFRVLCEARGL